MIIKCNCQHEQQDQMYGPGNRIGNLCKGGDNVRCTVCGTVKDKQYATGYPNKQKKDKK